MAQTNFSSMTQNLAASGLGLLPKAVLFVRDKSKITALPTDNLEDRGDIKKSAMEKMNEQATQLQKDLLSRTKGALAQTYSSLTSPGSSATAQGSPGTAQGSSGTAQGNLGAAQGYFALEVQYNPSTIRLDTQAGTQANYSGGGLGSQSNNMLMEIDQPPTTTMSMQLVFDDMNPSDAFMINSISLTGDLISSGANLYRKATGQEYSVSKQMDGLLSLLVHDETRQVIFFWSRMCFRGEVTNVSSRYTMFNKSGNPIRGVVDLTIRQGGSDEGSGYTYDEKIWDQAFDEAFDANGVNGAVSTFQKLTQNNFLNLNL